MYEHSRALDAQIERISALRWGEPDAEMEQQSPDALRWLEERADALRALAPAHEEHPLPVRVVRSEVELARRFRAGLTGAVYGPVYLALCAARDKLAPAGSTTAQLETALARLRDAATPAARALGVAGDAADRASLRARVEQALAAGPGSRLSIVEAPDDADASSLGRDVARIEREQDGRPGVSTLQLHAEWCATFGAEAPSPWEPLLACFERGVWPVLLRDELVVWVPVLRRGVIEDPAPIRPPRVWDTPAITAEDWLDAPTEQLRLVSTAREYAALVRYAEAGLATPPRGFFVGSPAMYEASETCLSINFGYVPAPEPVPCLSVAPLERVRATDEPDATGRPEAARASAVRRFWNWLKGDGSGGS